MKKQFLFIFIALLICATASGQEIRKDRLFMPKSSSGIGLQVSYFDFGSSDSDVMLLLKNLNATGSYTSFAPFYVYTYKNNMAIGARLKYSRAIAGISNADLSLFSEDLSLTLENIKADTRSFQAQLFHRSYMGLDNHGRFGLFNDIVLSYTDARSSFDMGETSADAYSQSKKVKLGFCPGIMIFILNNISTHVSMNIGGISYRHVDCVENGNVVGSRDNTKAHFAPDLTDISFGMTFYF